MWPSKKEKIEDGADVMNFMATIALALHLGVTPREFFDKFKDTKAIGKFMADLAKFGIDKTLEESLREV